MAQCLSGMRVSIVSRNEVAVHFADTAQTRRNSNLEQCDYQKDVCIHNPIYTSTGHGPIIQVSDPPRLLLYSKSTGPGDKPAVTIPDREPEAMTLREDHFNVSDYPLNTTVQTVMRDLRKGTVPLDADLRKKVDAVLEELMASEERAAPGERSDAKRNPDLNWKAMALEAALRRKEDFWEGVPVGLRKKGQVLASMAAGSEWGESDDSEASTIILPTSSKAAPGEAGGGESTEAGGKGKGRATEL